MADSTIYVVLLAAALLLLSSVWHGWASGLPRMVVELGGFVCASLAAWTLYPVVASWLQPALAVPLPIVSVLAGISIWLTVVLLSKIIALIFVKKTKHYSNPLKFIFGGSGALLGLLEGLFVLFACTIGLRLAGMVVEGQTLPRSDGAKPAPHPLAAAVLKINEAMDQSWVGGLVKAIDPVPPQVYTNLKKFNALMRNRDAIERLLSFPRTRDLLAHPRFQAVMSDPQVSEALRERKINRLMTNPNLTAAINDPEVWAELKKFPWSEALNYAVPEQTAPSTSPEA